MSVENVAVELTAEQKRSYAAVEAAWEALKGSYTSVDGALRGSIRNLSIATSDFAASFAGEDIVDVVWESYAQGGYSYDDALPILDGRFEGLADKAAFLHLAAIKLVDSEGFFVLIMATQVFESMLIDVEACLP